MDDEAARAGVRAELFAVGFAVAALFHLAGNPRSGFVMGSPWLTGVQLAVGLLALTVCLRRGSHGAVLLLCGLVPLSVWVESPVVGNHWVLAGLLAVAYLLAAAVARRRGSRGAAAAFQVFLPAGRLVVLFAYAFAAFAKLNHDFFDPALSCAVFYQDQLVGSWGLGGFSVRDASTTVGVATAVVAAGIELSVPILLALRRTRRAGLLVGLSFHWLLALDLDQHFWDFSSILFVGFLLFLDEAQVDALQRGAARMWVGVRRPARLAGASALVLAGLVASGAAALPDASRLQALAVLVGHLSWLVVGTGALVAAWAVTTRSAPEPHRLTRPVAVLWLVPLVVVANGLTPYLEVKTGFGWQMYSNLRTVDGETNHLLVPATLPLTKLQADRVEILAASDPTLAALVGQRYEVVFSELREYAHDHPHESVTYRRAGDVHESARIGQDLAVLGEPGVLSRKVQSFRVVDASGGERCLATFSPAR